MWISQQTFKRLLTSSKISLRSWRYRTFPEILFPWVSFRTKSSKQLVRVCKPVFLNYLLSLLNIILLLTFLWCQLLYDNFIRALVMLHCTGQPPNVSSMRTRLSNIELIENLAISRKPVSCLAFFRSLKQKLLLRNCYMTAIPCLWFIKQMICQLPTM